MSAWIVSKTHIDALVTAALAWELCVSEKATETGQMLWQENFRSIQYRYPDCEARGEWPGPIDFRGQVDIDEYVFELLPGRVDPRMVATANRSYRYQTCEHPGWNRSLSQEWTAHLAEVAERLTPGYEARYNAPELHTLDSWSFDDRQAFVKAETVSA